MRDSIAYCGPAAAPEDFWTRWNGDPLLIGILVILIIVVARGRAANKRAGWGAIALMAVIFVSPLCALSSALFSARVLHHMLLIAAVAPLLALAFPMRRLGFVPDGRTCWCARDHPVGLAYAWPLRMGPSQRTGLLADANIPSCKRLAPLAGNPRAHDPARVSTCRVGRDDWADGTTGRFDRFCPATALRGAFCEHGAWGLSPLTDQQLAGLLMWVPAILPYLGVGIWLAWSSLRPIEPVA